ncbi:hypothetical protein PENPOL_c006G04212 [Penicillium polonicum]|uniref:Ketoreductase (KR) domain-containing protein n=1 Tax=Penicillium polonicum TaxID=60169 RepID=A0A1V6NM77_PENPO|nr:hypothetical protein PENPOL_c006G04212 [Penicillium polonicum]
MARIIPLAAQERLLGLLTSFRVRPNRTNSREIRMFNLVGELMAWQNLEQEVFAAITSHVGAIAQSMPGVANFNYTQTPSTSHESTIQINWLGTALLTLLLLSDLNKQAVANPTRPRPVISIVGSETAAWAKFKEAQVSTAKGTPLIEVLDDKTNFDMGDRYYTSKLLYQLFFLQLVRSHRSVYRGAILNIVNPGLCYGSELHRTAEGAFAGVLSGMKRVMGRSLSMGARTLVHAAVLAGESSDGRYLSDCKVAPFAGYGDSDDGRKMQTQVWKETAAELSRVVDMDKLLLQI